MFIDLFLLEDHEHKSIIENGTRPLDELPYANGVTGFPANVEQHLLVGSELNEKHLMLLAADGTSTLVDGGLEPMNEEELKADEEGGVRRRRRSLREVRLSVDQTGAKKARHHKRRRNPLDRTGICFNGLIEDIKERYPFYKSDILDGIHVRAAVVCSFIFITCLFSTLMFATLLGTRAL